MVKIKENPNFLKGSSKEDKCYKYLPKGLGGLYFIVNDDTKQFYIGCSNDIGRRLGHHFNSLRKNKHICNRLQKLYNEMNYDTFSFFFIEINDEVERKKRELSLLNMCDASDFILNSATKNNSWVLNSKNKEQVEEWRSGLGEKYPKRFGEENHFYGKKHSEESLEKMRTSQLGKKNRNCWKPVVINGEYYESLGHAKEKIGIPLITISHRVRNTKNLFVNWYEYTDDIGIKVLDDRLLFPPDSKPSGLYEVEGKLYFTTKEIMEEHNVKSSTMIYRFQSESFPKWVRLV